VRALMISMDSAEAYYEKGTAAVKSGDVGSAISCFNQALQCKPDFREACDALGRALEGAGQFPLAIKIYEHLLKIEQAIGAPKPAAASSADMKAAGEWFHRGEDFQRRGDLENAAGAFRKVLAIRPGLPEAQINLGLALHYMRRFAEAEDVLLAALRAKPGFAETLNILGSNYAMRGQALRAIASWRQIIAADPNHLLAWVNLGKALSVLWMSDE